MDREAAEMLLARLLHARDAEWQHLAQVDMVSDCGTMGLRSNEKMDELRAETKKWCEQLISALTSPPAAPNGVDGWLPISSAPKDGTPILATSEGYSMPFVAWWGNDAYERGDLQSGGVSHSFDRHWCVAGCEDGDSLLYAPTYWKPITKAE